MFLFLLTILAPLVVQAGEVLLSNQTVDDTDGAIRYQGHWEPSSQLLSPLNFGGSHTLTDSTTASASFTFTGVAVYYLASLWPYQVDTYVSLDGGAPVLVNLTAPSGTVAPSGVTVGEEVVDWGVRWGATGLDNISHTIVVSRGPSGYGIVDGFAYTVVGNESRTASSSVQTSGPTETAGQAASQAPLSTKTIVLISVLISVLVTLIIVVISVLLWRARRRKAQDQKSTLSQSQQDPFLIPSTPATSGMTSASIRPQNMAELLSPQYVVTPWQGHEPVTATMSIDSKGRYPIYVPQPLPTPPQDRIQDYDSNLYPAGIARHQVHSLPSSSSAAPSVQDVPTATHEPSHPYASHPISHSKKALQPPVSLQATIESPTSPDEDRQTRARSVPPPYAPHLPDFSHYPPVPSPP
ncbi:hypothetical protein FRB91_011062 [Serendipita sp. 411]|nr:hypothetical protein FRC18_010511 [Serendipita sp. 400]KAG8861026.1 hypothetical protein FRB91_011062 [Serendipita sp. 411]